MRRLSGTAKGHRMRTFSIFVTLLAITGGIMNIRRSNGRIFWWWGAAMVLFVFVIMLLNAGEEEHTGGSTVAWLIGIPGLLTASVLICWALVHYESGGRVSLGALPGHPADIAQLLFHEFLLPFEVTSVLILVAIIGAIVLARKELD